MRKVLYLYTIYIKLNILFYFKASETFYNMMVSRGIIKPIPYGDLFIFGSSITLLLYSFRGQHNKTDSIYSLLR